MSASLSRFQTELSYDFLEIHDGPNLLSPMIGSFNGTQVPQFLFSSGNFLYLLFTTDNSRSNSGFKIFYEGEIHASVVWLTHLNFSKTCYVGQNPNVALQKQRLFWGREVHTEALFPIMSSCSWLDCIPCWHKSDTWECWSTACKQLSYLLTWKDLFKIKVSWFWSFVLSIVFFAILYAILRSQLLFL